ncbi:hypothetical protein FP388_25320 [Citrobacter europaeus]|nr:hypothetical protein [Citrobacter europaeus]
MRNAREFLIFDFDPFLFLLKEAVIKRGSQKRSCGLWITLCVNGYKAGFCCGMQHSVIFLSFKGCGPQETPYNAPPSTRRM